MAKKKKTPKPLLVECRHDGTHEHPIDPRLLDLYAENYGHTLDSINAATSVFHRDATFLEEITKVIHE